MERGNFNSSKETTWWRNRVVVELLEKIIQVNDQFLNLLKMDTSNENDSYTDQIGHFLNLREQLFRNVKKAETDEEKHLGEKIIKDNELINRLLLEKTQQLRIEINQFNQKKKNNQQYDNPYRNVYTDGMFIDKKK